MTKPADPPDRMGDLQKMRVGLVILISEESSRLLSRRQKVAGKEIEVLCAERDLREGKAPDSAAFDAITNEFQTLSDALAEAEAELAKMEALLARIDADIAALCQG